MGTPGLTSLLGERVAFVFPGQGSQYVGMGRALCETSQAARRVFQVADETLGFALSGLCFEGPEEDLQDTINAQPAILTVSIACLAALRERWEALGKFIQPILVAGHSLGEYTALVAAGALEFTDALRLVRERGRLMKQSGQDFPGGMVAVIGLSTEALQAICAEAGREGIITLANTNSPEQGVISGESNALERAAELARMRGARTVVPLRISIAAHSPLMQNAAMKLAEVLSTFKLKDPEVPIVANVAGRLLTTAEEVRQELAQQICLPVEWTRTIREMVAAGVDTFLEVGPGQALSRLILRTSQSVRALSLNDGLIVKL